MSRLQSLLPLILNGLMFQAVWLLCILGGDTWVPMAILILAVWLWWRRLPGEMSQITLLSGTGIVMDSIWMVAGLMVFQDSLWPQAPLIPLWLMVLWFGFSATLRHSMRFLLGRPRLAALLGATAAPLSYATGAYLADVSITPVTLIAVGTGWATLLAVAAHWIHTEQNLHTSEEPSHTGSILSSSHCHSSNDY